jgi:predicted Kef-type K+ transport protein
MNVLSPFTPAVDYLRAMLGERLAAARAEDRERGASVVEWVVITTIVVVLAVTIGLAITTLLNQKSTDIQSCISTAGQPAGTCNGN